MPRDIKKQHTINKDIIITFEEKDHSYIDNKKNKYVSVTSLISKAFPEFDKELIALKISIKKGVSKETLIKEWDLKSKEALRIGNRFHYYILQYILGNKLNLYKPENVKEKIKFLQARQIIDELKSKNYILLPEKLVFSPAFGIAGSIDLLVKINLSYYQLIDWKNLSKDLEKTSYNNTCGIIYPTKNILDCNYYHYALQLQIYLNLLRSLKYIDENAVVEKKLIVWNSHNFVIERTPMMNLGWMLMLWKNKLKFDLNEKVN